MKYVIILWFLLYVLAFIDSGVLEECMALIIAFVAFCQYSGIILFVQMKQKWSKFRCIGVFSQPININWSFDNLGHSKFLKMFKNEWSTTDDTYLLDLIFKGGLHVTSLFYDIFNYNIIWFKNAVWDSMKLNPPNSFCFWIFYLLKYMKKQINLRLR